MIVFPESWSFDLIWDWIVAFYSTSLVVAALTWVFGIWAGAYLLAHVIGIVRRGTGGSQGGGVVDMELTSAQVRYMETYNYRPKK